MQAHNDYRPFQEKKKNTPVKFAQSHQLRPVQKAQSRNYIVKEDRNEGNLRHLQFVEHV